MKQNFIDFIVEKFRRVPMVSNAYKSDEEMKEHFLSGEVTMSIKDVIEYEKEFNSLFAINQLVKVYFSTNEYGELNRDISPLKGTIKGIHLYSDKVKYDIELFWNNENGSEHTRIYNIDSLFVVAI